MATRGGLLSLVVFFFLGVSSLGWALEDRKTWLACKADQDCVIAESNCGCVVAINKNYEKFSRSLGVAQTCSKPACFETVMDYKAKCEKHACKKVGTNKKTGTLKP